MGDDVANTGDKGVVSDGDGVEASMGGCLDGHCTSSG